MDTAKETYLPAKRSHRDWRTQAHTYCMHMSFITYIHTYIDTYIHKYIHTTGQANVDDGTDILALYALYITVFLESCKK